MNHENAADSLPAEISAALWADVKRWFNEPRPGFNDVTGKTQPARDPRIKTISVARLQTAAGLSNALDKYLSSRLFRGAVAGPPADHHLPKLIAILRADYGYVVPVEYEYLFPPLF